MNSQLPLVGQATALIVDYARDFDSRFMAMMSSHWFLSDLIQNPISRVISETLFVTFVVLLSYETIYWSGIYLNLWEYHAKDIFTEVPIHCAHVYVRLNIAEKKNLETIRQYYDLKQRSTYNVLNWKALNELGLRIFKLRQFVKYHFEFSPEDFEGNPEPELGSTIEHLRQKVLTTLLASPLPTRFATDHLTKHDVMIFNNMSAEVGPDNDKTYLSKIHIETGNVIDAIVLI
ncbi:hypothetical protein FDK38_001179 [Candidozyma auris]|nr:hypothetical protein FDK38_001179 [[Candida] auris]